MTDHPMGVLDALEYLANVAERVLTGTATVNPETFGDAIKLARAALDLARRNSEQEEGEIDVQEAGRANATRFRMMIHRRRRRSSAADWSTKTAYVDKMTEGQILGYRLTNCRALFEKALSIQIFDRRTVALSIDGFTNDDHVNLTGEDGESFLAWLHALEDSPLTEEMWAKLGTPAPEAPIEQPIDMDKAALVEYLAQSSPQTFGRYGTIAAAKGSFYAEVLALVKDPARDAQILDRMRQAFEEMAHSFYQSANLKLRCASAPGPRDEFQAHQFRREAIGEIYAAILCRHRANRIAAEHGEPEGLYPEELDPETLAAPPAAEPPQFKPAIAEGDRAIVEIGSTVVITEGPLATRMGEIKSWAVPPGEEPITYTIQIAGDTFPRTGFKREMFRVLS